MLVRVAVLLLLTVCLGQQPCTRWHNCPPCGNGTSEVDLLAFLSTEAATQPASLAYFLNVRKALEIIKSFGAVHSDDLFFLHTTVSYLCCYLPLQYTDAIFPALDAVAWPPLNVSFGAAVCNLDSATNDPPANTTSIILLLDEQSQQQLGAVTDSLERAIRAAGLPVVPRSTMERYHSTLAVVPPGFPVQAALDAVNRRITDWSGGVPIVVDSFESLTLPHVFHATQ